jgi:hypothetical protein
VFVVRNRCESLEFGTSAPYVLIVSVKERAIRAIQELPEDADYQAVSEKLDFVRAVDEGIAQARSGKTMSAEEARKRLSQWVSE